MVLIFRGPSLSLLTAFVPATERISFSVRMALFRVAGIIYDPVLSINTRVTWPQGRPRNEKKEIKKKKGHCRKKGVYAHKRARDPVFRGGGAHARGAGKNTRQPYLIHRTNDTACLTFQSRYDAWPYRGINCRDNSGIESN